MQQPNTPRPPDRKRYGWFRQYNDFLIHPKWGVVSTMSCVDRCRVIAIVTSLEIAANKGRPRGSIVEFSVLECADALRIAPDEVRRVYKALEEVGWIDREYLTTWDKRQPDKEDPTHHERQARYRAKKRNEFRTGDTVTSVTETPRQDSDIDKQEAPVIGLVTGDQVTSEQYSAWLKEHRTRQISLPLGPVSMKQKR